MRPNASLLKTTYTGSMGNFVVTLVGNVVSIKLFDGHPATVTRILEVHGIAYRDLTHTAQGERRPTIKVAYQLGDDVEAGMDRLFEIFEQDFDLDNMPTFTYTLDDNSGVQVVVKVEEGAAGNYVLTISDQLSDDVPPQAVLLTLEDWHRYAEVLDSGSTPASEALLACGLFITDLNTSIGATLEKPEAPLHKVLESIAVLYP